MKSLADRLATVHEFHVDVKLEVERGTDPSRVENVKHGDRPGLLRTAVEVRTEGPHIWATFAEAATRRDIAARVVFRRVTGAGYRPLVVRARRSSDPFSTEPDWPNVEAAVATRDKPEEFRRFQAGL